LREPFRKSVVKPFVRGYARGETPNPCIRCNGGFRFAQLLSFARRAGAARLATGHYARIVERDGRLLLAKAVDMRQDQSYTHATDGPQHREQLWMPLGAQTSGRRAPRRAPWLPSPRRSRARRHAFSPATTTARSLGRHGLAAQPGPVVDTAGTQIGTHDGFWRFTPGQRRGLGSRRRSPCTRSPPARARTRSSPGRRLRFATDRPSLGAPLRRPRRGGRESSAIARRPSARQVEATATGFRLLLDEPAYGVARGQAAVLYDGDVVVGAGVVTTASSG
jgi:tRNA-specific 2-thiouridylase